MDVENIFHPNELKTSIPYAILFPENVLTDTESEETLVEKISLRQAIDKLPEKEAMVIRLRYFHGLTQDRASKVLQVSQVQVSRIEKKALAHLKELML